MSILLLLQSLIIKPNLLRGIFGIFPISGFLVDPYRQKFLNCRTSNDTDINLRPVTKLDKRNTATSKKLTMTPCQQIVTLLSFFQFMTNLEQSGSSIPDAWSVIFKFPFILTFYFTKTGNRSKRSPTKLSYYCFE